MGKLICDTSKFLCTLGTDEITINVPSSGTQSDGKNIANKTNHHFTSTGQCLLNPQAPQPCLPSTEVISEGQSPVDVDGCPALGQGCTCACAKGGILSVSSVAQSATDHA